MAETATPPKQRPPSPVLDACGKIFFFAFAAWYLTGIAGSERRGAIQPRKLITRALHGETYHAYTRGLPFEYYAREFRSDEAGESVREGYVFHAALANGLFWLGCLGVSWLLLQHKQQASFTMRELLACVTVFCLLLGLCVAGSTEPVLIAVATVVMCNLCCLTAIWWMRGMADLGSVIRRLLFSKVPTGRG